MASWDMHWQYSRVYLSPTKAVYIPYLIRPLLPSVNLAYTHFQCLGETHCGSTSRHARVGEVWGACDPLQKLQSLAGLIVPSISMAGLGHFFDHAILGHSRNGRAHSKDPRGW